MPAIVTPVRLRRAALVVAALLATAPAHAALDPAKLAADAQQILDNYAQRSNGILQPQGKVTALRDGGGVIVKLPALVIGDAEARVDIPGPAVRLEERDADHIDVVVTLPDTMTGTRTAPTPGKLLIQIGGQKIDGVYRPSLLTFERFDMLLEKVTFDAAGKSLALGTLRTGINTAEGTGGKWRSDVKFALGELRALENGTPVFSLGRFEQAWRVSQYDLPKMAALQRELTGGGNPFLAASETDPAKAQALAQAWFAKLPELLDGASGGFGMRMSDLQVTAPGQPPFALGRVSFDLGVAPEDALYGLQFAMAFADPRVDPASLPVPPHLVPRQAHADAGLRKLPLGSIWQALSGPVQQAMALEMAGKMTPEAEASLNQQMEMLPMAAMGMAAQAGSFAEIESFEIELGPARLTAHGVGPLMPGMPDPPLRVEAVIEGLEELAAEVQKLSPDMQEQAMPAVLILRGLGKPAAKDNKVVHTYLIEQAPDGQITVNGVSLDQMGQQKKQ